MNQELKYKLIENGYKGKFELSELIEACGKDFWQLTYLFGEKSNKWAAEGSLNDGNFRGDSPEETVAKLYLKLCQKESIKE